MNERSKLLVSIADTIKDYRAGEIAQPTPDHVDRWIYQFDNTVQVPLLREMDHVLKGTYLSKSSVSRFLRSRLNMGSLQVTSRTIFGKMQRCSISSNRDIARRKSGNCSGKHLRGSTD